MTCLLTSKIYQVDGTILVSVRIFVNKINTPLTKMIIRTTCKAVLECCVCLTFNSDISFTSTSKSTFITLVKSIQTSHQPTRMKIEKTI